MYFRYPARLSPDGRTVKVNFQDLPEALTSGDDEDDALRVAADCLYTAIAMRIDAGMEIPAPSRPRRGQHLIGIPPQLAIKAALHQAMLEAKVNKSELARRLNVDPREVIRMLDPDHATRVQRLNDALEVLGKRLVVSVEAA